MRKQKRDVLYSNKTSRRRHLLLGMAFILAVIMSVEVFAVSVFAASGSRRRTKKAAQKMTVTVSVKKNCCRENGTDQSKKGKRRSGCHISVVKRRSGGCQCRR